MTSRLLETHGCQGGAHAGYVRAGWNVTGVDIDRRHARYYPGKLIIADAAEYIAEHGHEYDAIHTSPPCQFYTRGNARDRAAGTSKWPRSIPAIREALELTGRPYVIENVTDAGWDMRNPVALCGCMFGLSTIDTDGIRIHLKRERLFETNWPLTAPMPCNHDGIEWWAGAYGGARRDKYEAKYVRKGGYVPPDKATVKALLGVEHNMTWKGCSSACRRPSRTTSAPSSPTTYGAQPHDSPRVRQRRREWEMTVTAKARRPDQNTGRRAKVAHEVEDELCEERGPGALHLLTNHGPVTLCVGCKVDWQTLDLALNGERGAS